MSGRIESTLWLYHERDALIEKLRQQEIDYRRTGSSVMHRDRVDLVLRHLAALSAIGAPSEDETAWLIELSAKVSSPPTYYGDGGEGVLGWTTDSYKAVRFARQQDAQAVLDDLGITEGSAVEHMWVAPRSGEDESARAD